MENYNLKIGCHVSLKAKDYFLGSVIEAVSYGANALMVYTGAPQNTIRKPTNTFKIDEAHELLKKNSIPLKNVIIHAPYIINLCSGKPSVRELAIEFLTKEIKRAEDLGVTYLVLHPGSRLDQSLATGLDQVIYGLNKVLNSMDTNVVICLETMSGKGSEVGVKFEELKTIIDGIDRKQNVGVCFDTCHVNDAGYNIEEIENVIDEFDRIIGLNQIKLFHINDSKNPIGAHKDRHENIGYGHIGFDPLIKWLYHPKFNGIIKILETPWVVKDSEKKISVAPYKDEIENIRNHKFKDFKIELIK